MPDPVHVEIDSSAFQKALKAYVDNEPDRHIRQQIEKWTFEWTQTSAVEAADLSFDVFVPSHILAGTFHWKGDYIRLDLSVQCFWEGTSKNGSIHFMVDVAKGDLVDEPTITERQATTKEANAAKRVRSKMIARLGEDDYVRKLINTRQNLVEASVKVQGDELEERVCCEDTIAEAIYRSLFTTAAPLDVFDFILSLPFLPTCAHETSIAATTALADRIKLRLMEEAAVEACDKEEEDELVDDLRISKKQKPADLVTNR